jgi:hypothetical protein
MEVRMSKGAESRLMIFAARGMTARPSKVLFALALIAGVPARGHGQDKVAGVVPQNVTKISTIGESLQNAGQRPVHILYVHGIGAQGAGDSWTFQRQVCFRLPGCTLPKKQLVPDGRDYADNGIFAKDATPPSSKYMGNLVWTKPEEWHASAPFVDHYVLRRGNGGPVVVDEINWWPLVFPLKCKAIMRQEAHLAGPDKTYLNLCAKSEEDKPHPGRYKFYPWINSDDLRTLESIGPKGALINRSLKNNLLDWGFSDAIMAVGSMHDLFREGMRQLFVKSARFHADRPETDEWEQQDKSPQEVDREFIVVSHSLGSYLVFSTLHPEQQELVPQAAPGYSGSGEASAKEDAAAEYILKRTSLVYFFANQVPLLELADVEESKATELVSKRMRTWRDLRENFRTEHAGENKEPLKPPQVVAWSDPSDLLTWCVPDMTPLTIVNLYVRNTWWHWILANPEKAHGNYASNKHVLGPMMSTNAVEAKGQVCQ